MIILHFASASGGLRPSDPLLGPLDPTEIIQVLGSVAIEESHNFNCITFFGYSVTVFQLLLKLQLSQTFKLQLQLLLTGFTLIEGDIEIMS